ADTRARAHQKNESAQPSGVHHASPPCDDSRRLSWHPVLRRRLWSDSIPAARVMLIEAARLSMSFPGVRALDQVDFSVRSGEVHALVGENGAGKSTLIRILSGEIAGYDGRLTLDGRVVRF